MAQLLRQIGQFGIKSTVTLTLGTQLSSTSLSAAKQVPGKIYTADIYSTAAQNKQNTVFLKAFRKKYKSDPDKEAELAYDSIMLTAQAMKKVGCTACTAKIAKALRGHQWQTTRGPLYINQFGLGTTTKVYPAQIVNGRVIALRSK
jgi:ABC-type branched-subunit amino acid transport system substrate-binding protein